MGHNYVLKPFIRFDNFSDPRSKLETRGAPDIQLWLVSCLSPDICRWEFLNRKKKVNLCWIFFSFFFILGTKWIVRYTQGRWAVLWCTLVCAGAAWDVFLFSALTTVAGSFTRSGTFLHRYRSSIFFVFQGVCRVLKGNKSGSINFLITNFIIECHFLWPKVCFNTFSPWFNLSLRCSSFPSGLSSFKWLHSID